MKSFTGKIIRVVPPKTVYVEVESTWMHPIYKKKKKVTQVFATHDETGAAIGDTVTIIECRPMSSRKYFMTEGSKAKIAEAKVAPKAAKPVEKKEVKAEAKETKAAEKKTEKKAVKKTAKKETKE